MTTPLKTNTNARSADTPSNGALWVGVGVGVGVIVLSLILMALFQVWLARSPTK